MPFSVQARVDDRTLAVTAKTAKEAFAKAVEWHVVKRFIDVSISDGNKRYSIAEFSSKMAIAEIAYTVEAKGMSGPRPARRRWSSGEERRLHKLLDSGKEAAEIAVILDRTRQAVYARLQRFYRKRARANEK